MARERPPYVYIPLKESFSPKHPLTPKMRDALERYAAENRYPRGLRGFHWFMKRMEKTYYDILDIESP